mmetsp:Transcript_44075/g.130518  ORF Transcript_44075/g.130518 Transcript_44075/m.130518 type:complete len:432 (+) Transcript_44075:51-1346(+)
MVACISRRVLGQLCRINREAFAALAQGQPRACSQLHPRRSHGQGGPHHIRRERSRRARCVPRHVRPRLQVRSVLRHRGRQAGGAGGVDAVRVVPGGRGPVAVRQRVPRDGMRRVEVLAHRIGVPVVARVKRLPRGGPRGGQRGVPRALVLDGLDAALAVVGPVHQLRADQDLPRRLRALSRDLRPQGRDELRAGLVHHRGVGLRRREGAVRARGVHVVQLLLMPGGLRVGGEVVPPLGLPRDGLRGVEPEPPLGLLLVLLRDAALHALGGDAVHTVVQERFSLLLSIRVGIPQPCPLPVSGGVGDAAAVAFPTPRGEVGRGHGQLILDLLRPQLLRRRVLHPRLADAERGAACPRAADPVVVVVVPPASLAGGAVHVEGSADGVPRAPALLAAARAAAVHAGREPALRLAPGEGPGVPILLLPEEAPGDDL